jgi:hypothetical protein
VKTTGFSKKKKEHSEDSFKKCLFALFGVEWVSLKTDAKNEPFCESALYR